MEYGYEGTKISQIMKEANLSRGGMYHYFSSKEDVLDAVIEYAMTEATLNIRKRLEHIPVEEKFIALATDGELGEFASKLLSFRDDNKNSIVGYKVREYNVYFCIPIVTEIIKEGVDIGIYNVDYPEQLGEFITLLVRSVFDTNLLPPVNKEEITKRIKALLHYTSIILQSPKEHTENLEKLLKINK